MSSIEQGCSQDGGLHIDVHRQRMDSIMLSLGLRRPRRDATGTEFDAGNIHLGPDQTCLVVAQAACS